MRRAGGALSALTPFWHEQVGISPRAPTRAPGATEGEERGKSDATLFCHHL